MGFVIGDSGLVASAFCASNHTIKPSYDEQIPNPQSRASNYNWMQITILLLRNQITCWRIEFKKQKKHHCSMKSQLGWSVQKKQKSEAREHLWCDTCGGVFKKNKKAKLVSIFDATRAVGKSLTCVYAVVFAQIYPLNDSGGNDKSYMSRCGATALLCTGYGSPRDTKYKKKCKK